MSSLFRAASFRTVFMSPPVMNRFFSSSDRSGTDTPFCRAYETRPRRSMWREGAEPEAPGPPLPDKADSVVLIPPAVRFLYRHIEARKHEACHRAAPRKHEQRVRYVREPDENPCRVPRLIDRGGEGKAHADSGVPKCHKSDAVVRHRQHFLRGSKHGLAGTERAGGGLLSVFLRSHKAADRKVVGDGTEIFLPDRRWQAEAPASIPDHAET